MRRPILYSLLALALLVPAAAKAQQNVERAAIHGVVSALADGIHTNQLGTIDQLFAPTGVHVLSGGSAFHGWTEYRDDLLRPRMASFAELRYAHTGIEASIRGNVAWVAFRWQMSTGGDGPAPMLGRGTAVLEKIDGSWLILHLHFSDQGAM